MIDEDNTYNSGKWHIYLLYDVTNMFLSSSNLLLFININKWEKIWCCKCNFIYLLFSSFFRNFKRLLHQWRVGDYLKEKKEGKTLKFKKQWNSIKRNSVIKNRFFQFFSPKSMFSILSNCVIPNSGYNKQIWPVPSMCLIIELLDSESTYHNNLHLKNLPILKYNVSC